MNGKDEREKDNEFNERLRVNLSGIDAPGDNSGEVNFNGENAAPSSGVAYVHPDAVGFFAKAPCAQRLPIFGTCVQYYGPKATVALGAVYFLSKGIAYNLIGVAQYAMLRNRFGIDAVRYQRLSSLSKMGFSIKSFTAMISDAFAVCGYTKRWFCAAACVVGGALTLGYALLPAQPSSADIASGFIFLTSFSVGAVDILSEGHYSRMMRRHPEGGPSLVSWIWWFILGATLIASVIAGPLADKQIPQVGLYVAAGLQLICTVIFAFNWYGEKKNRAERAEDMVLMKEELRRQRAAHRGEAGEEEEAAEKTTADVQAYYEGQDVNALQDELAMVRASGNDNEENDVAEEGDETRLITICGGVLEFNKEVCVRNWRILVYSSILTCAVVTMACVTILGTTWDLLYACIACVVCCAAAAFWSLPLLIAKVNIYFFCYALLYLQLPGALDSFYMATPECLPDGPHFNYTFYKTISAVIGNLAGIAAVSAFPYLFAKRTFRFSLMFTMFIQVLASLFDLVIVKRWNIYIGIPDHAMYIFGDAIVYEVSYYLAYMPTVILLSRVCPRGSESMIYALIAGFGNLGGSMSGTVGSLIMELAWLVNTTTIPCDFSNVPYLILVGHIASPLLIIPLSFLLIPNARICDDIDVEGHVVKKQSRKEIEREDVHGEPIQNS